MKRKEKKRIRKRIEHGVSGFFIIILSLSLLYSLFLYNSGKLPPVQQPDASRTTDLFVTYNTVVSHQIFWAVGYTSYPLLVLLFIAGIALFSNRRLITLIKPALFLCVSGIFIPLIISLSVDPGNATFEQSIKYGGIFGEYLKYYMGINFGRFGTYLFSFGALLISLVLTTNIRPSSFVDFFINGLKPVFATLPSQPETPDGGDAHTESAPDESEPPKGHKDNTSFLTPQELDAISKAFDSEDEMDPER